MGVLNVDRTGELSPNSPKSVYLSHLTDAEQYMLYMSLWVFKVEFCPASLKIRCSTSPTQEESINTQWLYIPSRPIVSFVLSPIYELSKYLSKILAPLIGNSNSFVSSSSEFVSFITSKIIRQDECLVSFDVISLFTKVPIELALDDANRRLSSDDTLPSRSSLSVQELLSLLEFCVKATYLCFRGRLFKQTYGTAMASPVSVLVANLVMEDNNKLHTIRQHTKTLSPLLLLLF